MKTKIEDVDALYYPYIHIRNPDWLKKTLLIFPHVFRIVPPYAAIDDDADIIPFCEVEGRRGPLLQPAPIDTQGVKSALADLEKQVAESLRRDRNFVWRFGRNGTEAEKMPGTEGFQIHRHKIASESLMALLEENELTWTPEVPDGDWYSEFHPRLGQAIMSTLAVACARDAGLSIVTDEHNARLNHCLAQKGVGGIYKTWIENSAPAKRMLPLGDGHCLLELIVYHHIKDTTKLTAETLAKLSKETIALDELKRELQTIAARRRPPRDRAALAERLKFEVNDALDRWTRDRRNLSKFAQEFFGLEGARTVGDVVKKLSEKALSGASSQAGAGGAVIGGLATGDLLGAAGGFGVGVVLHAASSWKRAGDAEANSPYRYLTLAERAGAAFTIGR